MSNRSVVEVLQELKQWAIDRHDYFGELYRKNQKVNIKSNMYFDLGEMDLASCLIDKIEGLVKMYNNIEEDL